MWPFLRKPYPYNPLSRKDLITNVCIGCFVVFFLSVFQPFGISIWHTPHRFLKIIGFGFVSFLCPTLFKIGTSILLKRRRPAENWNVRSEILALLSVLFFIATGNLLYGKFIGIASISFGQLWLALLVTFLLGIFPITANVALKYNRFVALNREEARQLDDELKQYELRRGEIHTTLPVEIAPVEGKLSLIAENEKDRLDIPADDLLYIESADNYSTVVYLRERQINRQLIRASLKRIESQITTPYIVRCHRSYIVNIRQAADISGNAQGYRIALKAEGCGSIPVSRNYGKQVLDRLTSLKAS